MQVSGTAHHYRKSIVESIVSVLETNNSWSIATESLLLPSRFLQHQELDAALIQRAEQHIQQNQGLVVQN